MTTSSNKVYSRIKTDIPQRVGREYEPVGQQTKLGSIQEFNPDLMMFNPDLMMLTQTSNWHYEQLRRLDVLGLEDSAENDQRIGYNEFKEQLERSSEGRYQTALPWKRNHPILSNNRDESLQRLENLVGSLEKQREQSNH